MKKSFEIKDLLLLQEKQKIGELTNQILNTKKNALYWAAYHSKEAKCACFGMNREFLYQNGDYQDYKKYEEKSDFYERELQILKVCQYPDMLKNKLALQVFEKYAYETHRLDEWIELLAKPEVLNNEKLLHCMDNNYISDERLDYLKSDYLRKNIELLEKAFDYKGNYFNKNAFIELCNKIGYNDLTRELLELLPEYTEEVYSNIDLFYSPIIVTSWIFPEIIKKFKWYCKNKHKTDNLVKVKLLKEMFDVSFYTEEIDDSRKQLLNGYKRVRSELLESLLSRRILYKYSDLLVSTLSPYTFVKQLNKYKTNEDVIWCICGKLEKFRNNPITHTLYQLVRVIYKGNKNADERLKLYSDSPIGDLAELYDVCNIIADLLVKEISVNSFDYLLEQITKIHTFYYQNPELIKNASVILGRTPILKSNISYVWALLLKQNIEEQNKFEKMMKMPEVRFNFTYNNGNSFYGNLLSDEKIWGVYTLSKEQIYKSKKEISQNSKHNIEDVFTSEKLKYLFVYDDEYDSVYQVDLTDVYRKSLIYLLSYENWEERDDSYFEAEDNYWNLDPESLKKLFEDKVIALDNCQEVEFNLFATALAEMKKSAHYIGKKVRNKKDKNTYVNPNVLVRKRVKKLPKEDLDDDFDIKFVI